jgi:hypothetical protein
MSRQTAADGMPERGYRTWYAAEEADTCLGVEV